MHIFIFQHLLQNPQMDLNFLYKMLNKPLSKSMDMSQKRVESRFSELDLGLVPNSLLATSQDTLKYIDFCQRKRLLQTLTNPFYINGMYISSFNVILVDSFSFLALPDKKKDHILTHEYGHMYLNVFFRALAMEEDVKNVAGYIPEPDEAPITFQDAFTDYLKTLKDIRLTLDERRLLEFNIFFDEIFAESTAIYFNAASPTDSKLRDYAELQKQDMPILSGDERYLSDLEGFLLSSIYEPMFTKGFSNVLNDAPGIYAYAVQQFDRRYAKLLKA
jgi:hypothetical protein